MLDTTIPIHFCEHTHAHMEANDNIVLIILFKVFFIWKYIKIILFLFYFIKIHF